MSSTTYPLKKLHATRYSFTTNSKTPVIKIVEFVPTQIKNIYNLGFGELLANGKIDDVISPRNGRMVYLLSTIVHIVKDFMQEHKRVKIVFTGSTVEKTALYQKILKRYHFSFSKEFKITALIITETGTTEVPFDPNCKMQYAAFFAKKII